MARQTTNRSVLAFAIEAVEASDAEATQLWHDLSGPSCAGTATRHCLVARERNTGRLLGTARYFRTFPPEDGCGAVLVRPEAAHGGVGERLLRAMAKQAFGDGIRNLGTVVGRHDTVTMDLLREVEMPVWASSLENGMYVEMDLVTYAHSSIDNPVALPLQRKARQPV